MSPTKPSVATARHADSQAMRRPDAGSGSSPPDFESPVISSGWSDAKRACRWGLSVVGLPMLDPVGGAAGNRVSPSRVRSRSMEA